MCERKSCQNLLLAFDFVIPRGTERTSHGKIVFTQVGELWISSRQCGQCAKFIALSPFIWLESINFLVRLQSCSTTSTNILVLFASYATSPRNISSLHSASARLRDNIDQTVKLIRSSRIIRDIGIHHNKHEQL